MLTLGGGKGSACHPPAIFIPANSVADLILSRTRFLATLFVSPFVSFGCGTTVGDTIHFVASYFAAVRPRGVSCVGAADGGRAAVPSSRPPLAACCRASVSLLQSRGGQRAGAASRRAAVACYMPTGAQRLPRRLHHSKDAGAFQQLFLATRAGKLSCYALAQKRSSSE